MDQQQKPRKKIDLTLPLVVALLLLFCFGVDQAFVALKESLRAGGGEVGRGYGVSPAPSPCGAACQGIFVAPPTPAFYPSPTAQMGNGGGGVAALAALERAQWEELRLHGLARKGTPAERWMPIEPRPSNPSRFFPQLRHPTLASGVSLSTSPPDPHWEDPAPRFVAEAPASASGPTWPFTDPLPAGKTAPIWPFNEPRAASRDPASVAIPAPAPAPAPEETRLSFRAPPRMEKPRAERLVEVCGHMVRESQAALELADCQAQQERASKPKEADEGGTQTLMLP
jgi:hypothetical protein